MRQIVGKIIHFLFAIFLIWQSVQLFNKILDSSVSYLFRDILINSLLINIFITGIFTIVYSFPIYKIFTDSYYQIKNVKGLNILIQILQVELFRKLLRITIWNRKNNKKHFFNGLRNGVNDFEENTKKSEFGHTVPFAIIFVLTIYIGIMNGIVMAVCIGLINILFNFYPLLLQRYHRLRLKNGLRGSTRRISHIASL